MPANITMTTDGEAEMMYFGNTPWHRMGQSLDRPATSKEAIAAAHLDWEINTLPVNTTIGFQNVTVPGKSALVRSDTKEIFNIMSDRYTPVQNSVAFNFFDSVVSAGEAIYHTAGSLDGGRKVWILAKLNGNLKVTNTDVLEKYILLSNSHDGSSALTMTLTPIRVVCSNTLAAAMSGRGRNTFYARHTVNVMNRANQAREILGLSEAYFENFMTGVNRMVDKQISQAELEKAFYDIYHLREQKLLEEQHKSKRYAIDTTLELFENGRGNDMHDVRGTAWAAYNAVTEFVDHYRPVGRGTATAEQKTDDVVDKRLNSAWFGTGSDIKQTAWDTLLTVATN